MKFRNARGARRRFFARFPRLAHWLTDPYTRSAGALWLWASAMAEVAAGIVPRHTLGFPVAVLVLVSAYRLFIATVHAAYCPGVTDPTWDPEDESDGGE